jgi:hypothetical protein
MPISHASAQAIWQRALALCDPTAPLEACADLYKLVRDAFARGQRKRKRDLGVFSISLCPPGKVKAAPATIDLNGVEILNHVFDREIVWEGSSDRQRLGSRLSWYKVRRFRHQFVLLQFATTNGVLKQLPASFLVDCAAIVALTDVKDEERLAILQDAVDSAGGWNVLRAAHVAQAVARHAGEYGNACYAILSSLRHTLLMPHYKCITSPAHTCLTHVPCILLKHLLCQW